MLPPLHRSTQASDASAQAFFNKMFDAIDEQGSPCEDMDLGNWADPLPRVAHYGGEPGDSWAWGLSEVLKKASSAWQRVAPIPSLPTTWKNLDAFLVDAASGKCEFVTLPLADVRQQPGGIEAAWNAPLKFAKARPDISSLNEALQKNHFEYALNLGRKLVNGIVCTQVGHTNLQLSLPTVNAAGLAEFYCGAAVDGEPMIRSFVTFVWALYNATFQDEEESGPRLLQAVFAHKTEETHYGELHWWSRCCNSDREASILVAPDLAVKKKRQCYAYLGGGQLSVASTTLLENVVVRVKSWDVGACVVAAAALLSRVAEDGHRVVPRADLWIAADDAAETEDQLAVLLEEEEEADGGVAGAAAGAAEVAGAGAAAGSAGAAAGAAGAGLSGEGFASLCNEVIAMAAQTIGLGTAANDCVGDTTLLRDWAASHCREGAPQYSSAGGQKPPPPPGMPAPRPVWQPPAGQAASSSTSSWWGEGWQQQGSWRRGW